MTWICGIGQEGNMLMQTGLSWKPEMLEFCKGYKAGVIFEDMPCEGCKLCTRMQEKWGKCEEDVDYVVPLVLRRVQHLVGQVGGGSNLVGVYT